jgi:broad specificity phosphatase PhoE
MTPSHSEIGHVAQSQELFLIRHASTDMTGAMCGHSDPPLSRLGRAQARALASVLGGWRIRRLYASDLQRAIQTAKPLAKLWNIPIAPRSAFREISFGQWEGKRWSKIRSDEPNITGMESSPELCAPGGESFACFRGRVLRALQETLVECDGHPMAIVTHLGVIRVVLKELPSVNKVWEPQERIDHCSVYRIRVGTTVESAAELVSKGRC